MKDVAEIHRQIYAFLMEMRNDDPSLRFTFRKSNRGGRLEKEYWFYGNEYYVSLSFWSGMDWKNKTPNIVFTIPADGGACYLEVNTSDAEDKRRFVSQFLVKPLGLELNGVRYQKIYAEWGQDYLGALRRFIETDKRQIDEILRKNAHFWQKDYGIIGFITDEDFEETLGKVQSYQLPNPVDEAEPAVDAHAMQRIRELRIGHFGPIKSIIITDISFSTPWIFFTGENGTGKTSILRAIATGLCQRKISSEELHSDDPFHIALSLYSSKDTWQNFEWNGLGENGANHALTFGFAAYGASRLRSRPRVNEERPAETADLQAAYASLFDYDTYLLDLHEAFGDWRKDPLMADLFERRKGFILEILTDIFPYLYSINFEATKDGELFTTYIERDDAGAPFREVRFNQLASGLKSLIGMIGDILIRLYHQQPEISDPAEFRGIVLIDEIDIHLHPKLQKELVEQLTRTFPRIQFIVTTHSPIPLLGAPKGSLIFKVERNSTSGVTVQRLDDKLTLGDLLPNTILTSPIFGLDDIVPSSHDAGSIVRTETDYTDLTFNDQVKKRITAFLTDEKEQQLIDAVNSRAR